MSKQFGVGPNISSTLELNKQFNRRLHPRYWRLGVMPPKIRYKLPRPTTEDEKVFHEICLAAKEWDLGVLAERKRQRQKHAQRRPEPILVFIAKHFSSGPYRAKNVDERVVIPHENWGQSLRIAVFVVTATVFSIGVNIVADATDGFTNPSKLIRSTEPR